ncbi:olfactory receptor 52Z1P-like [Moschus berezovskii]|uniref:olfactory receptor 52Z1P-like n=1 Tax=Moschus berezovskii TaxID=68408 RepID=UPI0024447B97|nr:olfactory receptor 52Z1P-like [Moschus berezovskii]
MAPSSYIYTRTQDMWYVLLGIPGLEDVHTWISIPICFRYIVAIVGNLFLIFLIVTELRLHEPMYLFLSTLALADVLLTTSTVPKMLAIFWFHSMSVSFGSSVFQMFFIHFIFVAESAVLLAMAFECYVAICYPLRYTAILTSSAFVKTGIAAVVRSFIVCFPFIFLVHRLVYCGRNIIPHSYGEHMGIARLACDNIDINTIYGLTVALLSTGLAVMLIIMSYTVTLCTVFQIPSWTARFKALSTCGAHICVILMFCVPAFFSFFAHRFGGKTIPRHICVLVANLYVEVPPGLNSVIYGVEITQIQDQVTLFSSPISICC